MPSDPTLAARLREAAEGSRELDAAIAVAAGVTPSKMSVAQGLPAFVGGGFGPSVSYDVYPKFTTSLDAITALIEARGFYPDLVWDGPGYMARVNISKIPWVEGATPALALCVALAAAEGW